MHTTGQNHLLISQCLRATDGPPACPPRIARCRAALLAQLQLKLGQTGENTCRRALPITKRIARNGKVSYTLQIDAGTKPDGSRDRRRYTYTTLAEAKREYARITTEAAAGRLVRRDKVTLGAFLTECSTAAACDPTRSTATAQPSSRLSTTSAQCRYSTSTLRTSTSW